MIDSTNDVATVVPGKRGLEILARLWVWLPLGSRSFCVGALTMSDLFYAMLDWTSFVEWHAAFPDIL